jgi:putative cell wall-binding protein
VRSGIITGGGAKVTRLQGPNRYETAAAVSRHCFANGAPVVVVASGVNFADALVAAPFGVRGPILLTETDRLPISTATEIRRLKPKEIIIVGGLAAVSQSVENELNSLL